MGKVKTRKKVATRRSAPQASRPAVPRAIVFEAFVAEATSTTVKIDAIRAGINASIVDGMARYFGVSKNEIFGLLRTPASTAHRLIKDRRPLDPATSERVVRVADIARIAEATFGGPAAAAQWLKTPNLALENVTPLSMLDTEPGAGEVRRLLASIDYGGVF